MSFTTILALVWFGAAVVFGIVEAITTGLASIWFAGGAVAAGIVALFTDNIMIQVAVFLVISIVLLVFTRPMAKKYFNNKAEKTNIDAIIGAPAVVLADIRPPEAGQVKADGKVWTAVADEVIEAGSEVKVIEVKGVTLRVGKED